MNPQLLTEITRQIFADDKGILAMDESYATCNKRFAKLDIPQTAEARRAYRDLVVTTPRLSEFIGGAILCDETIRQSRADGASFLQLLMDSGIVPGIKVDKGLTDLAAHPGESITEGLDGLRERLHEYYEMGARFSKWRSAIVIGDDLPSRSGLEANAHALARFAALSQEAGLVPIVEPEVLMDGDHTLESCRKVTEEVLRTVFIQLNCQRVQLEGMILKPNMILPGLTSSPHPLMSQDNKPDPQNQVQLLDHEATETQIRDEEANITVKSLWRTVPAAVPVIAFLSGGQSPELASARLNVMNYRFKKHLPWVLAYSFARAIQQPALDIWQGKAANSQAAQEALLHRARCNQAARRGEYTVAMESR